MIVQYSGHYIDKASKFILIIIPYIVFLTLKNEFYLIHPLLNLFYIFLIFLYYKYIPYLSDFSRNEKFIFFVISICFSIYYIYTGFLMISIFTLINILIFLKNFEKNFIILNFIIIILFFSIYNPSFVNIISLIFLYYLVKNTNYIKIGIIILLSIILYPAIGFLDGIGKGIYDKIRNENEIIMYKCYKNIGCGLNNTADLGDPTYLYYGSIGK